jgi:serine protease Do
MRGIDLETFRFDFDLTFYVLLMNADGTVYHRYGGRDETDAMAWLSMPSFVRFLNQGLATHEEHQPRPPARSAEETAPFTLDSLPVWRDKVAERERRGQPVDCYHCHFVFDADREQRMADGTWSRDLIWRWPPPGRVGLTLNPEQPESVQDVRRGSPAAVAGLRAGDRLLRVGEQRILSHADLSWVLEDTPAEGARLAVAYEREGRSATTNLELAAGWREGTPLEFSWRPSKWQLRPRPGFGGPSLEAEERRELGLPPDGIAFRVNYIVTWGPDPRYGRNARDAGIRQGDVVVGVALDGQAVDLNGPEHLHSWWRLTRQPGETVELEILRGGRRRTLELPVIE